MQRVILMMLCIGGCTWIGLRYADSLRRRAERLKSVKDGVQQMISAIRHTNQPLDSVAEQIAARSGCVFWREFADGLHAEHGAEDAWKRALLRACEKGGSLFGLNNRDRAVLNAFSGTLGKTDRYIQTETAKSTLDALDALIAGAEDVYTQKGRVYRVLGLFFGLGLAILLW